jgi:MFS family permease
MPTAADPQQPQQPRLFERRYLPFVIAAVSLVTLAAFENRATSTILPSVARDLHGLSLFGAAAAAPLVSYVVGVSIAGLWADRSGPVPVLATGIVGFTVVAGLAALAPVMGMFVAVRLAAGVAEGILDIGLTVMVARAIPPDLRARLFSLYAAAWVLPSLVGPSIAGLVAEHVHWRAVFLIAVVLMPPLGLLLRPATRSLAPVGPSPDVDPGPSGATTVTSAVVAAVAMSAIALSGSMFSSHGVLTVVAVVLAVAGIGLLVPTVRRLLPDGVSTLRRGAPALIAVNAFTTAAFMTPSAFLPLMLTSVHRMSPAGAGLSLTLTGLFWAGGSNLVARPGIQRRTTSAARMGVGLSLIAAGVLGTALLCLAVLPVWAGLSAWAVAGTGMGIASNTQATTLLALAPAGRLGQYQAASALLATVASTIPVGAAGAAIAWFAPNLPGGLFAAIMSVGVAAGIAGAVLARRVTPAPTEDSVLPEPRVPSSLPS